MELRREESGEAQNSAASCVQKTVLPNGLTVITEHVPGVRSLSVGLWTNTGSRDETPENNGAAHFIEHMVFKGTSKRDYIQISKSLESVGGYLNAFTTKEHTCFYARSLAEHLKITIDVLTDLVFRPTFPEEELEKEKDVIIEEIKSTEDTPDDLIFDDFDKFLFESHPLGLPIAGTEESVDALTRNDTIAFLKACYRPEKMLLVGTGNLTHDALLNFAECFVPKRKTKPKSVRQTYDFGQYQPFTKEIAKPIQQAHILIGAPYIRDDKNYFSAILLNTLLGGGMSSRLNLSLREKHGLVYSVFSSISTFDEINTFSIYAGTDKDKVKKTVALIHEELGQLLGKNVPKRELDLAKAQLKGAVIMGQESVSKRQSHLARDHYYFGRDFSFDELIEMVESVSAKDIRSVAEQMLDASKFSTLIYQPKRRGKA
ncbi:processing peptidase [Chloroherpeton thalassium ATCC 35110]|uniref:Processing peptidase n=1 Tax=Chloroherpeton thalassium (strain ATCC 35110 / GB-78) TaxID=517418 RepID=B3QSE0_CHLT3|nr:pitrilysin family protein [Chloroherpeton thalassium]ACF12531.1 processing peptidase [Chloroherpeton thalassium ATCC 35110]